MTDEPTPDAPQPTPGGTDATPPGSTPSFGPAPADGGAWTPPPIPPVPTSPGTIPPPPGWTPPSAPEAGGPPSGWTPAAPAGPPVWNPDGTPVGAGGPPPGYVAVPATPPSHRGRNIAIGVGLVVIVLLAIAAFAGGASFSGSFGRTPGTVVFGTAAGSDVCSVGSQSDTIYANTPYYFSARLNDHMTGSDAITLTVTKDGQVYATADEPANGQEFDCYGNKNALDGLDAGIYVFTITHNGTMEATGTLKVV
jgi:hypothetical protein